jgi:hypothetical protein
MFVAATEQDRLARLTAAVAASAGESLTPSWVLKVLLPPASQKSCAEGEMFCSSRP